MIELSLQKIISVTGANLVSGDLNAKISSISIDSRKIQPGDLFIAIKGENFDGSDFIQEALKKGACGYISQKSEVIGHRSTVNDLVIQVDDSLKALQQIANLVLRKVAPKVIAITGSTGKTSVKDMLKSILFLKHKVVASAGNYNNEVGLPLTLLNLDKDTEIVILEMAMRGLGQISQLCKIAPPDYAVITNIGHSHIEKLQSKENIIKAKAEIIQGLKKGGTIFLNSDDASTKELIRGHPFSKGMSPLDQRSTVDGQRDIVFFGSSGADVAYEIKGFDKLARPSFTLSPIANRQSPIDINLPIPGMQFVSNASAAASVALELGMTLAEIKQGLELTVITPGRMQICQNNSWTIINDAYNASPDSMKSALEVLKTIKAKRKIAVLGTMRELGALTEEEHFKLGLEAANMGMATLFTVGELAKGIAEGALAGGMAEKQVISFADVLALNKQIISYLTPGDAILIKASRAVELEKTVYLLQQKR